MDLVTIALLVVAVIAALGAGLFVGWKAAQKSTEGLRDDNQFLRQAKEAAANDLAAEKQRAARADEYKALLEEVTKERDEANKARAAMEADARNFETRIKDVEAMRKDLAVEFSKVGDEMLAKANKEFLEKAGLKFGELDKETQAKMQALVGPLRELLDRQEKKIAEVEKERVDQYSGLKAVIEEVKQGQGQVRDEARNLVNALRSGPKQRGRWGEKTLENVLQQAGLAEHIDYQTEVSVDTDDGRLRPDAIVNLPGGRKLVIDSKCALNAYLDAVDEVDEEKRSRHFAAHVAALKKHAQDLGSKSYWAQFDDAADYVVMFVPGEHFLNAALEQDAGLWDWAFEKKVLLATPTNLVAIARTVASVWKQEKLAAEAGEIAALGRELHSRLATMADHVASMQTNLSRTNNAFNKMVGSFESQVLTQARRFEDYGSGSAKELPDLGTVESVPRQLTKIVKKEGANDADDAA
ncbi:DNA recombination protein RmuC [Sphingomicrobium clamense]|uniref:DNA recombination protein RmuC homolog n=1 Tax=Sphingomicrobium clamense TaxID=2851013 RepID=A0ABS6V5W2_9SPHN|nr:DNA recombination protein RmuC [Sphingomicrobium sp. B8]MBW0144959.1 DNA recombination protein RmuC [Sphingomicrobium sp. B8]